MAASFTCSLLLLLAACSEPHGARLYDGLRGAHFESPSLEPKKSGEPKKASKRTVVTNIPGVGSVRGRKSEWQPAIQFWSIPFAKPPLLELALMPPEEYPTPWDEVKGTEEPVVYCYQGRSNKKNWIVNKMDNATLRRFKPHGQRDCLYLNVFMPRWAWEAKDRGDPVSLPVMFFIFGGGFQTGGAYGYGVYDGASLAQRDVIVVTSNYRVAAEGFLAHPAMLAAGGRYNLGLLDQRMAMRWVSSHIHAFGGDPGRVTLFGESAGAMSICFHLVSPHSFPYYHRAVLQSPGCEGSATWLQKERAEAFGLALSHHYGCANESTNTLPCLQEKLKTFQSMNFQQWSEASFQFGHLPDTSIVLVPVIDLDEGGLRAQPNELIEQGLFNKVPIIVGTNKDEGDAFRHLNAFQGGSTKESFTDLVYHIVGPEYLESAVDLYSGPIDSSTTVQKAVVDFLGDGLFVCPTRNFARAVARHHREIYFYRFVQSLQTWEYLQQLLSTFWRMGTGSDGRFEKAIGLAMASFGVSHMFDLFFVFNTEDNPDAQMLVFGDSERRLAEYFQYYWTNLAATGDPNLPPEPPEALNTSAPSRMKIPIPIWKPFGVDNGTDGILRIKDPPTMSAVPGDVEAEIERRCQWWSQFPDTLRARQKPWQMAQSPTDLGLRCCCDMTQDPPQCGRAGKEHFQPQDMDLANAWTEMSGVKKTNLNWRSHCPRMRFKADGAKVPTEHHAMGCTVPDKHVLKRCCCVKRKELSQIRGVTNASEVCVRVSMKDTNWKGSCPKLCMTPGVAGESPMWEPCRSRDSRLSAGSQHNPTGSGCGFGGKKLGDIDIEY